MKIIKRLFNYLTEYVPWNSMGCRKTGHTYQYASCPFTGMTYGDCTSCGHRTVKQTITKEA